MLRTRLWMGAILIGLTVGVLVIDRWLAPWYPFLLALVLVLSLVACHELILLLGTRRRLTAALCYLGVLALVVANWVPALRVARIQPGGLTFTLDHPPELHPWFWVASALAAVVLLALLAEMAVFEVPGGSVARVSLIVWVVVYLGLLPSFLLQLRWLFPDSNLRGATALALAIFVPKLCDTGAYFTGRYLGRHRMAPVLSPKKTWEGTAGGLVVAILATLGINAIGHVVHGGLLSIVLLGLALGIAGTLGDLAESLIKRDCGQKDASHVLPGFGGVLDLVDSILFAAPLAYWWLR